MSNKSGAIVIFIKTPGFSPVKTRLAKSIGKIPAETFHTLAAQATEAVVQDCVHKSEGGITPYFAVAEEKALNHPLWEKFTVISQGEGEVGDRLFKVYNELREKHRFVILVGADCPQMNVDHLAEAIQICDEAEQFVLGPCDDGGFFLFGGSKALPRELWQAIPYSSGQSTKVLNLLVKNMGTIKTMRPLFDVDTIDDLHKLEFEFASTLHHLGRDSLLPAQHLVLNWVKSVTSKNDHL